VQAAEAAVRRHLACDGIDDLRVDGLAFTAADGRTLRAEVRHVPTGQVRAVSCGPDAKREDPGRFEVTLET
jgi:hypothetical protein